MIFDKIKQIFAERKELQEKMEFESSLRMKRNILENKITDLINNQDYSTLQTLVQNGYILSTQQNNLINNILNDSKNDFTSAEFKSLVTSDYLLNNNNLSYLHTKTTFNSIASYNFENIRLLFNSKLFDKNFLKQLHSEIIETLAPTTITKDTKDFFHPFYTASFLSNKLDSLAKLLSNTKNSLAPFFTNEDRKIIINHLKNIDSVFLADRYSHNCAKLFKDSKQKIIKIVNDLANRNSDKEILNLLADTKEVFLGENVEKNISKLSEEQVLSFSIKKLPENIQLIISKIENNCQKLNSTKDVEIQHIINQTIDKILPETLKKYSFMDEEYKTSLKNKDGKTAQDLLIESLNNMNDRLVKLLDNKNENQLLEMEIGATFTRKLKNC